MKPDYNIIMRPLSPKQQVDWRCMKCGVDKWSEPEDDMNSDDDYFDESLCLKCYWVFRDELGKLKEYTIAAKYAGTCYFSLLDIDDPAYMTIGFRYE